MSLARRTHRDTLVFGAGALFVATLGADGAAEGERYLGDTLEATLSVEQERVTVRAGDGPNRVLTDRVTRTTRTLSVRGHDLSFQNWELAIAGSLMAMQVAGRDTVIVNERHISTAPTRSFELRAPSGTQFRIKNLTLRFRKAGQGFWGGGALVQGLGFVSVNGRTVTFPDAVVEASFSYIWSILRYKYKIEAAGTHTGAVRYIEEGPGGRQIYIPRAAIQPDGEIPFKSRDEEQRFGLRFQVLPPSNGRPDIIIEGAEAA